MQIAPVNAASAAAADQPSQGSALGGDLGDTFMQILVTQLKNQDPMSPMDPNSFVDQLVSLNSLNELINIRQILSGDTTQPTSASTPATTAGGL